MLAGMDSHVSSLAVVLPEAQWEELQQMRKRYDPSFGRWPPHINIFFPFVSPAKMTGVSKSISEGLEELSAFLITFDESSPDFFTHSEGFTVFLRPNKEAFEKFASLRAQVASKLGHHGGQFVPHLSVARHLPNKAA